MTKIVFLIAKLIFKGLTALVGWWSIPIMGAGIAALAYLGKNGGNDADSAAAGPEGAVAIAAVGSGVLAAVDDKTAESKCCEPEETAETGPVSQDPEAVAPDTDSVDLDWIEFA